MRGRSQTKKCCFCGRNVPADRMVRFTRSSFSYFDERAGIKHRGIAETKYCCPQCAKRRGIEHARIKERRRDYRF